MTRVGRWLILAAAVCLTATAALGQEKPAERPKTLLEEIVLFSYVENSVVFNLNGNGRGNHNELRVYDFDSGYTFNIAEFSAKKDPSERYPFGFGVVLTAGQDAQKNHALGIFRDSDDAFPFRNTPAFDLEEAYGSYKIPLGSGLTVKAGKFVTLLGYEVIESPNNLNFSRSFLFGFAIPLTHVGALVSYAPTDWLTVTAGPVVGWDVARDNNDSMSVTGQFALTPFKDLTANFNWITGPEQVSNTTHPRTVLDWTATTPASRTSRSARTSTTAGRPGRPRSSRPGRGRRRTRPGGESRRTPRTTGRSSSAPPCGSSTSTTPRACARRPKPRARGPPSGR